MMRALKQGYHRAIDLHTPDWVSQLGPDEQVRIRLLVGLSLTVIGWAPLASVHYVILGIYPAAAATVLAGAFIATIPMLLERGHRRLPHHVLLGATTGLVAVGSFWTGGIQGAGLAWVVVIPPAALALTSRRATAMWTFVSLALIGAFAVADLFGLKARQDVPLSHRAVHNALVLGGLAVVGSIFAWLYERRKQGAVDALEASNEALRAARDEARESEKAQGRFLADMSHEIRTPLNGVAGMTDLLLTTKMTAEQRDYARAIRSSADAVTEVINEILDLSKLEAGQALLSESAFELSRLLADVVILAGVRARENGLDLVAYASPDVPRHIVGDRRRLQQVLTNLVSNAVKFTMEGDVTVSVALSNTTGRLRFSVRDTGVGIPEEELEQVFQAFRQGSSASLSSQPGTGLGLAISSGLVQLMRGELTLQSQPGLGSTFMFEIDLALPAGASHPVALPHDRGTALVVDSGAAVRVALGNHLGALGYQTRSARTAEGGVLHLSESPTTVILADVFALAQPAFRAAAVAHQNAGGRLIALVSAGLPETLPDGCLVMRKPTSLHRLDECLNSKQRKKPTSHYGMALTLGLRVLVVDDQESNRRLAIRQLEKLGCLAEGAANGLEAVERVLNGRYHLVLMDFRMPEMDGPTATRRIRSMEAPAVRTRIVAMTAAVLADERKACMDAGMDDLLAKPLRLAALREVVAAANTASQAAAKKAQSAKNSG